MMEVICRPPDWQASKDSRAASRSHRPTPVEFREQRLGGKNTTEGYDQGSPPRIFCTTALSHPFHSSTISASLLSCIRPASRKS